MTLSSLAFLFAASHASVSTAIFHPEVIFNGTLPITAEAGGMKLSIHHGNCNIKKEEHSHHCLGTTNIRTHPLSKRHLQWQDNRPTKFVWLPPSNIPDGGCLHAFLDGRLVGTSHPVIVVRRMRRRQKSFADVADPEGPWFDGVQYLQQMEPDKVFVAREKGKKIGIIGGGMAGLMTAVCALHLFTTEATFAS